MKNRQFSMLEILFVESLFFFAFFGLLKFLDMGNPRLFITVAIVLLAGFFYIGTARFIDIMKKEEMNRPHAL
ncbi:MAG: hypothetical protein ABIR30_03855 [Chitinophagaceae bacterium]